MMDSGPVRNMWSTLSNIFDKLCILLAFIIRIYHDAQSSECQIPRTMGKISETRNNLMYEIPGKYELTIQKLTSI
jgi:hypothetical protein